MFSSDRSISYRWPTRYSFPLCCPPSFSLMAKRAQGRNRFFRQSSFKPRYFRLTTHSLSYAKSKGQRTTCNIPLRDIFAVEQLHEKNFKLQNIIQVRRDRQLKCSNQPPSNTSAAAVATFKANGGQEGRKIELSQFEQHSYQIHCVITRQQSLNCHLLCVKYDLRGRKDNEVNLNYILL